MIETVVHVADRYCINQRLVEYGWDPHRDFGPDEFFAGHKLRAEDKGCGSRFQSVIFQQ